MKSSQQSIDQYQSSMESKITIFLFMVFLPLKFQSSKAQAWIRAGYWYSGSEFPISNINSELFTHLICAFADVNSTSYKLSISSSNEQMFSTFAYTVKQKNPSVTTLLSVGGGIADYLVLSEMVSNLSHRKSFIDSSIRNKCSPCWNWSRFTRCRVIELSACNCCLPSYVFCPSSLLLPTTQIPRGRKNQRREACRARASGSSKPTSRRLR